MANVDTILQTASSLRQVSSIESEDLFGAESNDAGAQIKWQEDVKNLSIFEVLLKEKDSLGLFVSGNPLNEYFPIQEWARETAGRDDIFLVLVTKVRKIFTKAGQMMLTLQITLNTGEIEGVIFPKRAMDLSPKLVEAEMFWVRGKISMPKKRETKPEVVVTAPEEVEQTDSDNTDNTDEVMPTETVVDIVKEYDELPKLLIDNLAIFEEGPLSVLLNEDIRVSVNREKALKSKNWAELKQNPDSLFSTEEVKQIPAEKELTSPNTIKVIKITKQMGAEVLTQIKKNLKTEAGPNLTEVELWVENQGELKKVKGNFWLPKTEADKF